MKVRNVQFGERKNPDSSRVHGLRLAVDSLPIESVAESDNAFPKRTPGGEERTNGQLLTVEEVARLLRVPVSWVYGRTRKRSLERLPGYRLGKYWRFREEDITAWLESQNPQARSL
jgi:excisionase family DNA binding protein